MDETPGRCISCGFLSYENRLADQSHEHQEVGPEHRVTSHTLYHVSIIPILGDHGLTAYLSCYLRKADLLAEVLVAGSSATLPAAVESVLGNDRRCPYYCRYQVGLSPKEHLMERRLVDLEEDRRAFQRALSKGADRLMWAALILAAGQIIAALVAMTPDSYAAKWFQRMWSPPAQTGPEPNI